MCPSLINITWMTQTLHHNIIPWDIWLFETFPGFTPVAAINPYCSLVSWILLVLTLTTFAIIVIKLWWSTKLGVAVEVRSKRDPLQLLC